MYVKEQKALQELHSGDDIVITDDIVIKGDAVAILDVEDKRRNSTAPKTIKD